MDLTDLTQTTTPPPQVAAALAFCEFLLSKELLWYVVSAVSFGGALHWWSHHTLGFLTGSLSLPCVNWLPWLGSNGSGYGEGKF